MSINLNWNNYHLFAVLHGLSEELTACGLPFTDEMSEQQVLNLVQSKYELTKAGDVVEKLDQVLGQAESQLRTKLAALFQRVYETDLRSERFNLSASLDAINLDVLSDLFELESGAVTLEEFTPLILAEMKQMTAAIQDGSTFEDLAATFVETYFDASEAVIVYGEGFNDDDLYVALENVQDNREHAADDVDDSIYAHNDNLFDQDMIDDFVNDDYYDEYPDGEYDEVYDEVEEEQESFIQMPTVEMACLDTIFRYQGLLSVNNTYPTLNNIIQSLRYTLENTDASISNLEVFDYKL